MRIQKLTAVTIGKFDGFHLGHRRLLEELCSLAQKGYRPVVLQIRFSEQRILSFEEEEEVLQAYGNPERKVIPFTPEFSALSPEEFVRKVLVEELSAAAVVVGMDFRFGHDRAGDLSTLQELGEKYSFTVTGIPKLVQKEEVISSSRIRKCLEDGLVGEAEELLGHDLKYSGEVLHGKALGRTLGFPTINIIPSFDKLLPRFGVYRSRVFLPSEDLSGQKVYEGISNIGIRPTVSDGDRASVETHILGFSGDLYGKTVSVQPVRFLRPEIHFASLDELKNQIKKDLKSV